MPKVTAASSEFTVVNGSGKPAIQPTEGFRIVNRVIDWVTTDRMQLINITDRINDIVKKSGIRHTTASVFLNEWQDALLHDVRSYLESVVNRDENWRHNDPNYSDCERKNADSHMRGMLMGQTLSLQVRNASLLLGTWQNIIFAEFDGPRSRSMSVQIMGL
jgi:secondary thiamine-phosphate synthase enzyme